MMNRMSCDSDDKLKRKRFATSGWNVKYLVEITVLKEKFVEKEYQQTQEKKLINVIILTVKKTCRHFKGNAENVGELTQ